ncbi:phosphoglycerate mutase [Novacetimonas maltaceti]|uniref:Phosphoglycerate mutase n=1 Tax=Novacetimonas maltaceti TaxID=1203393 RepID=A0A2S3VXC3_9PROT|nr:histidine phosphatase family protein [Novacetimonas maltaceti]POF61284.1 hypothetical protein KMAL_30990 [Novacetimonas maltaceti]PYD59399.1 phosphoglycerate mutase [Novacetimonas maltaceti]
MDNQFLVALARHPAVRDALGRCYGRADMMLDAGWEQVADGMKAVMRGIGCEVIFTSPATRCRLVAQRIATALGLEIRVDGRLHELDFGRWEGMLWQDVPRPALDAWARDVEGFTFPEGENGRALRARVGAFWDDIVRQGRACAVVTHGGPLRLMHALARGDVAPLLAKPPPMGSVHVMQAHAHRACDAGKDISGMAVPSLT